MAGERDVEGDLMVADMGEPLPFRAGVFDGAISISALQWLCQSDRGDHNPKRRLKALFNSLFACLVSFNHNS